MIYKGLSWRKFHTLSMKTELKVCTIKVKACLARGYIPRYWGQVKMIIYLHLGRSNILRLRHTVLLVYCPQCREQCKTDDQEYQG
jgi:hypothetical protein